MAEETWSMDVREGAKGERYASTFAFNQAAYETELTIRKTGPIKKP
jgi:hypothetical protein